MNDYSQLSLWLDGVSREGDSLNPRPGLDGDTDVDVAIVGGGYTGLWTAYYLTEIDPSLRIVVIEREVCGFGASGRNGGWIVGELASSVDKYAKVTGSGRSAALAQLRGLFDAVDEVGRVTEAHNIDCRYAKGGTIRWARNRPQLDRQIAEIEHEREIGLRPDEIRLLSAEEAMEIGRATDVMGGIFLAASAAHDPARLVRGLATLVEARGVKIVEQTAATDILAGEVQTNRGVVRAEIVVRATEAYTRDLPGHRRTLVPIFSRMIATEPLSAEVWDQIGLTDRPTFSDDRYMVIYGQRTGDDRIAFGGRGVPYLFGSRIDPAAECSGDAHQLIHESLVELFPVLQDAAITHRWGGVLAAPRNWMPAVRFDQPTGLAVAGGYVGEGVAAANLAGRTVADLVTGQTTERVTYPWVNAPWGKWEPEPLRYIGVRGTRWIMGTGDDVEYATDKPARRSALAARLLR